MKDISLFTAASLIMLVLAAIALVFCFITLYLSLAMVAGFFSLASITLAVLSIRELL